MSDSGDELKSPHGGGKIMLFSQEEHDQNEGTAQFGDGLESNPFKDAMAANDDLDGDLP